MALAPRAPELRDKVRFERRSGRVNVGGVIKSDWAPLGVERSARVIARTGGEGVLAARLTATQPFEITVRHDSQTRTISPDDRVVDARDPSRVWAIKSIGEIEGGRNRWLNLLCEAGGADGR